MSNQNNEVIELLACTDCMLAQANGDVPEDDNREEEVNAGFQQWAKDGYYIANNTKYDENNVVIEPGFTSGSCEICNSPLGSDKHDMAAIPNND